MNLPDCSKWHLVLLITSTQSAFASTLPIDSLKDSVQVVSASRPYNLKLTTRVHSLGIFGYAGRIANTNPTFDISVSYDRKKWGCMFLKAVDLYDSHSPYHFSLALVYKKFKFGNRITTTPYAGFVMEQRWHFIDHDSDGMILLITSMRLSPKLVVEHCSRFSNTFLETEYFDWLNRFRFLYTHDHWDLTLSGWHNNKVFDRSTYTTVGFSAAYSRIHLSENVQLSTILSGLMVADCSNEVDRAAQKGLMFTIAATVD